MSLVKSTWHHLKTFAGAPEAINRLRTKYTVVESGDDVLKMSIHSIAIL